MITLGLVVELRHIEQTLNTPVTSSLKCGTMEWPLFIEIKNGVLSLNYGDFPIWRENVSGDLSMFGPESCQVIAEIIYLIDKKTDRWKELVYFEPLDIN